MSIAGVWSWSYSGGAFEVNFVAGGEFVCTSYPAHSHWTMEGNQIKIDWSKYGKYEMDVDCDGKSMVGFYSGYPDEWRKAVFVREHTAEETEQFLLAAAAAHSHDHSEHSHKHGSTCCASHDHHH